MKKLSSYIVESNIVESNIVESTGEVKNRKFLKLMKDAGLEKVLLCKGNGYYWITSDDDETYDKIQDAKEQTIYVNSFNQQTPEQWVEDVKNLLKDTELIKQ